MPTLQVLHIICKCVYNLTFVLHFNIIITGIQLKRTYVHLQYMWKYTFMNI